MKVFISWSGDLSKNIAEIFRQWLPSVIQAVKPYYSPDDVAKGTRWNSEISKELDESKIGIICLTRDNIEKPWIMFEAGAISKNLDKAKVCPLLFGLEPTDIQGPLVQFQSAKFSKKEMKKVVKMINSELGENSLGTEVLENVFEKWWPDLEKKIQDELSNASQKDNTEIRSERDILEEILKLSRDISVKSRTKDIDNSKINMRFLDEMFQITYRIFEQLLSNDEPISKGLLESVDRLARLLDEMTEWSDYPKGYSMQMRDRLHMMMEKMHYMRREVIHKIETKR